MTKSMCLSFIYKIQSEYRAQITVLTERISRFNKEALPGKIKIEGQWE